MFVGHKKFFPAIWFCFHGLILSAFLVSLLISPEISFGTSLFEILPPSSSLHEVQKADNALGSKTGRAVTILAKADSFEKAKQAAEKLYSNYLDEEGRVNPDFFDTLTLYVDSSSIAEITKWLHENRFALIDEESRKLLVADGASEIADQALSSVYGAFSISELANLEEDPFLLSERNLHKLLDGGAASSTNMSLRDEVLFCEKDGDFYVLIRGRVSEKGSALASKKNTVKNIYDVTAGILRQAQNDGGLGSGGLDFIFSGVPFHSYESSSSAQAQISVISTVSLVLIVVVFLYIFRSIVPALVSALAVAFSCGIGFLSVLLFFRGIHVLTFVFGTTLIGTCLDYSIHYFVNWKANPDCDSGDTVRKHIFRGISLGFASTEICFAALFFAPFPLLKQVSVFLFTGLAAAYLSVVALYPMLKIPEKRDLSILNWGSRCKGVRDGGEGFSLGAGQRDGGFAKRCVGVPRALVRAVPVLLVVLSLVVICANYRSLKIQNNIQELYSMSKKMLQNEISSAKVLNTGASGWYFIVKADSEEKLLQKNEELSEILDSAIEDKKLGSYLSVVQFIPSEKVQKESYVSAKNLLPLVREQYEALGFGESNFASRYEESYRSLENRFVHPTDSNLPTTIRDAIANLWIGEIDGAFYSCVMPLHALPEEEQFFREYAGSHEGIFFVNKVKDISAQLDILSKTMLKMLALAFVLVIAILCFCYKARLVLKIAFVPLLVTLVTTAVLLLCKIHLSFFPITALVLVFGLGLDYIIYAVEAGENIKKENSPNLTSFAIFLSFLTTALSFGALAISTFPPVHFLGLTVFVGLLTAVVGAFCVTRT
ncbi:MAG: MMPL family transporter [Treponema sp.]|nr:MMPL family transporter [Treponema sp.]